jgi:DNA-binding beta-propeller fold protein YncE
MLQLEINQNNSQIDILDRQTGKVLSSFGRSGHLPGQFDQPLGIDVDSMGNVYVTENRGKRVQKFKRVGQ